MDDKIVTLQIWDTAGQERFQSLGYAFYRGADCCALVFDITNPKTFDNLNTWKEGFITHAQPKDPENFPFVVMGNKIDKGEEERKVTSSKAELWCKQQGGIPYCETSAKHNENVHEAFKEMVVQAIRQEKDNGIVMPGSLNKAPPGLKLDKNAAKKKKEGGGCSC